MNAVKCHTLVSLLFESNKDSEVDKGVDHFLSGLHFYNIHDFIQMGNLTSGLWRLVLLSCFQLTETVSMCIDGT